MDQKATGRAAGFSFAGSAKTLRPGLSNPGPSGRRTLRSAGRPSETREGKCVVNDASERTALDAFGGFCDASTVADSPFAQAAAMHVFFSVGEPSGDQH